MSTIGSGQPAYQAVTAIVNGIPGNFLVPVPNSQIVQTVLKKPSLSFLNEQNIYTSESGVMDYSKVFFEGNMQNQNRTSSSYTNHTTSAVSHDDSANLHRHTSKQLICSYPLDLSSKKVLEVPNGYGNREHESASHAFDKLLNTSTTSRGETTRPKKILPKPVAYSVLNSSSMSGGNISHNRPLILEKIHNPSKYSYIDGNIQREIFSKEVIPPIKQRTEARKRNNTDDVRMSRELSRLSHIDGAFLLDLVAARASEDLLHSGKSRQGTILNTLDVTNTKLTRNLSENSESRRSDDAFLKIESVFSQKEAQAMWAKTTDFPDVNTSQQTIETKEKNRFPEAKHSCDFNKIEENDHFNVKTKSLMLDGSKIYEKSTETASVVSNLKEKKQIRNQNRLSDIINQLRYKIDAPPNSESDVTENVSDVTETSTPVSLSIAEEAVSLEKKRERYTMPVQKGINMLEKHEIDTAITKVHGRRKKAKQRKFNLSDDQMIHQMKQWWQNRKKNSPKETTAVAQPRLDNQLEPRVKVRTIRDVLGKNLTNMSWKKLKQIRLNKTKLDKLNKSKSKAKKTHCANTLNTLNNHIKTPSLSLGYFGSVRKTKKSCLFDEIGSTKFNSKIRRLSNDSDDSGVVSDNCVMNKSAQVETSSKNPRPVRSSRSLAISYSLLNSGNFFADQDELHSKKTETESPAPLDKHADYNFEENVDFDLEKFNEFIDSKRLKSYPATNYENLHCRVLTDEMITSALTVLENSSLENSKFDCSRGTNCITPILQKIEESKHLPLVHENKPNSSVADDTLHFTKTKKAIISEKYKDSEIKIIKLKCLLKKEMLAMQSRNEAFNLQEKKYKEFPRHKEPKKKKVPTATLR